MAILPGPETTKCAIFDRLLTDNWPKIIANYLNCRMDFTPFKLRVSQLSDENWFRLCSICQWIKNKNFGFVIEFLQLVKELALSFND